MRSVLVVAGAAILASPAGGGGFPRFAQGCTRHDFASGGATVRAELCRARGGTGAAVVVLQALRAAHVPTELYVYPKGSHDWPGRQGTLGIARAATFLRRYLG